MILSKKQAQNPPMKGAVDNITKSSSSIVSDPVFNTLFLDFIQLKYHNINIVEKNFRWQIQDLQATLSVTTCDLSPTTI